MQETPILSVTELTSSIKKNLESQFRQVTVQGEIINLKQQASGHLYFTLKDSGAQISAVLFRLDADRVKPLPSNGDQVVVQGEISVYAPRGNYQLIIRHLKRAGIGELLAQLHALKVKLSGLGWFDPSRKKPLPVSPKTIGVVTSPTGAVIHDILNVLSRRHTGFHLILNPVKVQGEGAAEEIAQAIDQFNQFQLADVIIACRGGGSLEDLWSFNKEIVASAIYRSKIPVISAVGHETDFSIADFVADLRAPTPSVAAELVMTARDEHLSQFASLQKRISQSMAYRMNVLQQKITLLQKHPLLASPFALLEHAAQRLDDYADKCEQRLKQLIHLKKLQLEGVKKQLMAASPQTKICYLREKLQQLTAHLKAIDPKTVLKKGYAIVFHEKRDFAIVSSKDLHKGDSIRVTLHDGEIKANVYEV